VRISLTRVPLLLLLTACGNPCGPATGLVSEVADGDTIALETGEKIRYLLVDAPEITQGHNDCYGKEASDFNRALVLGRTVSLKYDDSGCKDRFGRLLAYVTVDDREVNTLLLERGYACVLYIAPAGTQRKDEFLQIQDSAKASKAGLWGACSTSPCAN
jgi:micrococcal nuclease